MNTNNRPYNPVLPPPLLSSRSSSIDSSASTSSASSSSSASSVHIPTPPLMRTLCQGASSAQPFFHVSPNGQGKASGTRPKSSSAVRPVDSSMNSEPSADRRGSSNSIFYREEDYFPEHLGSHPLNQTTLYPPPPHTTISGPPSSIGLCNGRPHDNKNNGNLCALEYSGTQARCFYCDRDLK